MFFGKNCVWPISPCMEPRVLDERTPRSESCIELIREISRAAAVIGESRDGRQNILIPALTSKARLHSPDGQERPRRDAIALLDGCEECGVGLLECASSRHDRWAPALSQKLIKRQTK